VDRSGQHRRPHGDHGRDRPDGGRGRRRPEGEHGRGRPEGDRDRPRPLRRYGQNHLVDRNVLQAIVAQAAVGPDDVVLEVGAAGGLLTRPLLERARFVHSFEVDRRFVPRLEALAAEHPTFSLHVGDALRAPLAELSPAPTTLVANLAYNIAIPLIVTSVAGLPTLERWAVMVQRELGERLFARPSTKPYSAVSVLVQLACELERSRPVPRNAFRPRPNVESSFVTFTRRPRLADGHWEIEDERLDPQGYARIQPLVRLAFTQRRKLLTNALSGAGPALAPSRDRVREVLKEIGAGEKARPEELSPAGWVRFARALGTLRDGGAATEEAR
jgi:16S rRNA (adenine1518-N6/adenine1519-N6)-dimethyltransferase